MPHKRGAERWNAKLTEAQALEVLRTHPVPEHFYKKKALEYGVSKHTIYSIRYRKSWAYLDAS